VAGEHGEPAIEQRGSGARARAVFDREGGEPRLVGEVGGAIDGVEERRVREHLAFAGEAGAGAGELGPCRRGSPRGTHGELHERDGVELGRAERRFDALLDVARGEALGEDVAVWVARQRRYRRDARCEDDDVAQAQRADRVCAQPLRVGFLGDIDEPDAELEPLVDGARDIARVVTSCRGGRESYISAAHHCDGRRVELSLSHGASVIDLSSS
jgi:hypothetical protein